MDSVDFDKYTGLYVALRDKITETKKRHDDELKPLKEGLDRLSGMLLDHLNTINADSVRTSSGTVTRSRKDSASVADMEAFWAFVEASGDLDFVDRKANVSAVRDYMQETGNPVPGINFTSVLNVGVRRATNK